MGIADLVAKVKPAVISVRVKMDQAASPEAMSQQNDGNDNPFQSGSPFKKFFRQFPSATIRMARRSSIA